MVICLSETDPCVSFLANAGSVSEEAAPDIPPPLTEQESAIACNAKSGMKFSKSPERLQLSGYMGKIRCLFKHTFQLFVTASMPDAKHLPGPTKTALVLSLAGDDALEVNNNFAFNVGENQQEYATVSGKFKAACNFNVL